MPTIIAAFATALACVLIDLAEPPEFMASKAAAAPKIPDAVPHQQQMQFIVVEPTAKERLREESVRELSREILARKQ